MGTWIYFLWFPDARLVKIGRSDDVDKRMKQLALNVVGAKHRIVLLCCVRGVESDESVVQRFFSPEKTPDDNEAFWPRPRLIDYIRWLRDQWFVRVPPQTKEEWEELPMVQADRWLPDVSRGKAPPASVSLFDDDELKLGERVVTGDDYYTNEEVIETARRVLGVIDLDPASHAVANKVVRADRFYTIHDNGLLKEWAGRVWLNPPFAQWESWVPKILAEWGSGRVECLCVFAAMRTITAQYFSPIREASIGLCVMNGRRKLWGPKAAESLNDGHCIFYFGTDLDRFVYEFSRLGTCYQKSQPNQTNCVCVGESRGLVYRLQKLWHRSTLAQRNEFLNWTEAKD